MKKKKERRKTAARLAISSKNIDISNNVSAKRKYSIKEIAFIFGVPESSLYRLVSM